MGIDHFHNLYKSPDNTNLAEIIRVARLFPRFLDQDAEEQLMRLITLQELEDTLKWFQKDKSPGQDGWPIEFYLDFFNIMGQDILNLVEYCRTSRRLYDAFNSTFIALIPKSDNPQHFSDFFPISLCNCIYKIISKIIANRINPILSEHISPEQFAFLHHLQIHEAIGIA